MKGNNNKRRMPQRFGKLFRYGLLCVSAGCLLFLIFGAVHILGMDAWDAFDANKILNADQNLIIYDKEGREASILHSTEDRIPISIHSIPDHVQKAFISAEDARFYDHIGVDFIRIVGAAWQDLKAGAYVQGASTISQQLIKLSHLSSDKTIDRKLEEAVLAYQMERQYEKDEILEMYLNFVYFGGGYYGIEAASRGYFGVSVQDLTVAQGAMLAGILKSPSNYAPHLNLEASIRRRNTVLDLMYEYGYLTEEECSRAKAETVTLTKGENVAKRGYYIDETLTEACQILDIDMEDLLTGGYRIYTGMDSNLQQHCETLFEQDEMFPSEDAQGAVVVVDTKRFEIAAMVGGRETDVAMGYNRAMRIRRQPGSVIKPIIVYAPALEQFGYTAASMLLDEKTDFNGYTPQNYGGDYYGWVTLRTAVAKSLNIPAVKVLSNIGVSSGILFAKRLGIEFDESDRSLALALGGFTYGVSPCQVAGAYACFASGGIYSEPGMIRSITDSMGNTLYERGAKQSRIMSEENAYILTSMLQSAITDGTGRRLSDISVPLAGKTGTVGDTNGGNRDAWMAAYNTEYSAAVWMGCDRSEGGISLPSTVTGGTYPAMMLKSIFNYLYREEEAPDFIKPDGIKEYRLDRYSLENLHVAVLPTALTPADQIVTEVFSAGTAPVIRSSYWAVPEPPNDLAVTVFPNGKPNISFTPLAEHTVYLLYREEGGFSELLYRHEGSLEKVFYCDETAISGKTYQYYVIPYHPNLKLDGRQVTGASSIRVSCTLYERFPFPQWREMLDEPARNQ